MIAGSLVWFASEHFKVKRIAVVTSDDDLGRASDAEIKHEAAKTNIDIVVDDAVPNTATDVTATALKNSIGRPRRRDLGDLRRADGRAGAEAA